LSSIFIAQEKQKSPKYNQLFTIRILEQKYPKTTPIMAHEPKIFKQAHDEKLMELS
jgi:hypothetical protein